VAFGIPVEAPAALQRPGRARTADVAGARIAQSVR